MAISVLTNVTSMLAQSNLGRATSGLSDSMSRLSSGLRVRSAADDAAGLAISEDFKASGYDLKRVLRILLNTETYQRTSKYARDPEDRD